MEILRPSVFWLLLALPLLGWWWHRSIAALRGRRKMAAGIARCLVAILIIFAMAEPRWMSSTQDEEVFLLVDQSASLEGVALEAARGFFEPADFAGAETAWLAFAGKGRIFTDLEDLTAADPGELDPGATRIDSALGLANASFQPGRVPTVVLFSDGLETGDTREMLGALVDRGIRIHTVPVKGPDRPEVLVREVRVPTAVRAQEPVSIEAVIQSTRSTRADVDLFRNGVRVTTRNIELRPGSNPVLFEDRAESEKLLHYEVGVRAAEDTLAENNQAGAAVISEGSSRVLLLTDRPESARYLELALRQEGIDLGVRPSEGVPTQMSDLQNFDAVILDNVPASAMSRPQMELLHAYVSAFGGGLIMLGGDQAYGLGGYFRSPIEDLLPVQCDFQKDEETPSLALALVIDRSGSMSGDSMELAKSAAKASVDLLGPRDFASVIAFDSEAYPIVPLQSAANKASVGAEIASIQAGGGTSIAPALEEALRQLSGSTAKLKHVILLTDGFSSPGPFQELTAEMTRNLITVSTVAVGNADTHLLAQIAQWGNGRYYETTDWSTVPQIFTKETMTASKSAIQEFPFLAKPVRAVDFLEGVPWGNAPFLLGYVRTKAKPTSETWLITESGDPLLSTWRFGLGTTAAFTSDARNRWAVEWLRWNGFGKFWAQLLRRLSRPASLGLSEIHVRAEGEEVLIRIDALDPEQGFPANVGGSLRVLGPDGKDHFVPLEKRQPGRWQASFPAKTRGIYSGQIVLERDGAPYDSRFFTHARGFSSEYLLEPPDEAFLRSLADASGGTFNPDPAVIFNSKDRSADREIELWPWLALFALLVFVGEIAIRRWPDPKPKIA